MTTWLDRVEVLAAGARRRWPQHAADVDEAVDLARKVAHHLPHAVANTRHLPAHDVVTTPAPPGHLVRADLANAELDSRLDHAIDLLRRARAGMDLAVTCLTVALTHDDPARAHRNIAGAADHLRSALGCLHRTYPKTDHVDHTDPTGPAGCASCRRIPRPERKGAYWQPVFRSGLCEWCWREAAAAQAAWEAAHPGREVSTLRDRRWWPAVKLVEWRRDHGNSRLTPAERVRLEQPRKKDRRRP